MPPIFQSKLFKQFAPFMVLVVGGSFLVREFADVRYKYRKVASYDIKEEATKRGIKFNKSTTLEEEYEKLKQINLDNWENVRIPRSWEESTSTES